MRRTAFHIEQCATATHSSSTTNARGLSVLAMTAKGVRRDKAALSSGCKSHPANAPAGSSRSSYGGDEIAEAFGKRVTKYGDSASVQAVTRVNAEQASKRSMRRPTRQPFRGRLIRLGE